VHAGGTYIASKTGPIHSRLLNAHFTKGADATFTVKEVSDTRHYGVAEVRESDTESLQVIGVEEKPTRPKSKFAIMPLYVFTESVFESLRRTKPDRMDEIQLTDAI
jgi:glucose-1-phosphate thymidylyltransferase